jgi:glycosyltransferase involved in cell wall biosynthesis
MALKIAMIGTRGVPANYSGFEACVEEVGKRLVNSGHSVTVYCRKGFYRDKKDFYLGMKLVYFDALNIRSLETLSHTALSVLHTLRSDYDILMVFNSANSPLLILPRLLGKKIVINTDGLEWKRGKWGSLGKLYFRFAELLATKLATRIITDSPVLKDYYKKRYAVDSTFIAYGAELSKSTQPALLDKLGLKQGEYYLQITRFEPENNPLITLRGFQRLKTDKQLVLVGGVRYESSYSKALKHEAQRIGAKVILPGYIFDKALLNELRCNCFAYIHGNEVGGTNPALLEAMASSTFVASMDVNFNRSTLGRGGMYFDKDINGESLSKVLSWAEDNPEKLSDFKSYGLARVREKFCWNKVAADYEQLFKELLQ